MRRRQSCGKGQRELEFVECHGRSPAKNPAPQSYRFARERLLNAPKSIRGRGNDQLFAGERGEQASDIAADLTGIGVGKCAA